MAELFKPGSKLGVMRPLKLKEPKSTGGPHVPHFGGLFHSSVPGRTDKHNIAVPHDSYIVPADVVSNGLGQGNTLAGAKVLDHLTGGGASGGQAPSALNPVSLPGGMTPFASGGRTNQHGNLVPIIVAGGEYHIMPDAVKRIGGGSMKAGHQILDHFVKQVRKKSVKETSKLPGPKR